ncbi:SRPBCC family protein [Actinokineospora fastidiosa]|uniref:Activator of Hsp90 ATPase homologue 1/2-like C-terminal domain-containing protein n=1 Tax=Actinokineospora fastidiosa TaxID=1816 RepID=A0A918GTR2_9PSEU|nr:SRPBCC domain-containing protein [Actinokineospora fastidiosa]GGS60996.1 hypothetical protein GCM10010171_64840 [Actinokineospora fastidiosa]
MKGEKFEVRYTAVLPATPAVVWDALTVNAGGWLWPVSYEPRVGGRQEGLDDGVVTEWDPERRLATHASRDDGWFNTLTYTLEKVPGGTRLDYVHQGVHENDYATEQAACVAHTDLYFHTLGQYVAHFPGRTATYVSADAPAGMSYAAVLEALGLASGEERVRFTTPDGSVSGIVDYRTENFLGVRTEDALYRFFGRDTWGWPVGVAHHLFGGGASSEAWEKWLGALRVGGWV